MLSISKFMPGLKCLNRIEWRWQMLLVCIQTAPIIFLCVALHAVLFWLSAWQESLLQLSDWRTAFNEPAAYVTAILLFGTAGLCITLGGLSAAWSLWCRSRVALHLAYLACMVLCCLWMIGGWWAIGLYGSVEPAGQERLLQPMQAFWLHLTIFSQAATVLVLISLGWVLAKSRIIGVLLAQESWRGTMFGGDRIIENTRTGGRDPAFRRSWQASLVMLIMMLFGPYLLTMLGCVDPYRIPDGSGTPMIQVTVQPQVKRVDKILLNPNSETILWNHKDVVSDAEKMVEKLTQQVYVASGAGADRPGSPGSGPNAGWPGVPGGKLRWIQLNIGHGSDDGLNDSTGNAVANMLRFLRDDLQMPFPVAERGEFIATSLLAQFPRDGLPPWVALTSDYAFALSGHEMDILSEYVGQGGMIFADAGSPAFDRSMQSLMQSIAQRADGRVVTIGRDDFIHQAPFQFPDGLPTLSAHAHGGRPMGVRGQDGRWLVYYFPGDLNDAWKDNGTVSRRQRRVAFEMGTNIMYYAIANMSRRLEQNK